MNRRTFLILAAIFLLALETGIARGQDTQSGQTPPQTTSQPTPPAPQKKVWTNEDLSGLSQGAGISTSRSINISPGQSDPKHPSPANGKDTKWYQDQISKLEAKIPPIDEKIAQLHATIEGQSVTAPRPYHGVGLGDWKSEMEQLQKQRDNISSKITALQDQARHHGIPPNELP